MSTAIIQRQYDELIAENYDLDPQDLTRITLDQAFLQLANANILSGESPTMKVLDLGMGTGLFYDKLGRRVFARFPPLRDRYF